MRPRTARQRSALANGARPFLKPVAVNSHEARFFKDVLASLEAERPAMSETQRQAARAFAALAVVQAQMHTDIALGRTVDHEAMGQIADRLSRLSRQMGPPAKPQRTSLRDHLAAGGARP
ncbi:hypothetical protein [Methylobacterium nigriterrae]|uniref:hypothetical protein n=1 Tax=Methylobacterium nigriterrae TaxID=3127512 RepID=UPI00301330DD